MFLRILTLRIEECGVVAVFFIVLTALLVIYIGLSVFFFRFASARKGERADLLRPSDPDFGEYTPKIIEGQEWIRAHYSEKISIRSRDRLKLTGLLIPAENARGTVIAFHGYHSRALVDFAPEAEFLVGLGYNLILPCQRSHDESEGRYITFGAREQNDCRLWVEYADRQFGGDIFLAGISMGSATVMMASALQLPPSVKGIIADCGYTSAYDIMIHVACKIPVIKYLIPLIMPAASVLFKAAAGFDPEKTSAREALANTEIPVLFIHGGLDDFVPPYMTEENYAACASEKRVLVIEGAQHAQAYVRSPKLCEEAIASFISDYAS